MRKKRLFCELGPTAYAISKQKQILIRHIRNLFGKEHFAKTRTSGLLPVIVHAHRENIIKKGPGIDPVLQHNKAANIALACSRIDRLIVHPGETFSFWNLVGRTSASNGFLPGRVIVNGRLIAGVGGGLCNLANTLHILFMHSPLTITELHHHSDALAPDPDWKRIPYSAGTSVNYNYLDLRFRNDTDRDVQIVARCDDDTLAAELRSCAPFPHKYRITEEDHHFHASDNRNYYRISKIYRETIDPATGSVINRELKWNNRSKVMFDPSLIPPSHLR